MQKNYYELIGLELSASQTEIDEACISLSKQYNPNTTAGNLKAKIQFKEIEEAYETLGNPEKRAIYDAKLLALIRDPIKPQPDKVKSTVINPYLVVGIIIMPYIFCWFLLRKGYSKNTRIISFGWLILLVGLSNIQSEKIVEQKSSTQIAKKDGTIDDRENDLDELCKDWVFFRAQILKNNDKGDDEAAEKSRRSFGQTNIWLSDYSEADVSSTCGKYR